MLLKLQQIIVSPGERILIQNINWSQFEEILSELGDKRNSRISYYQRTLEIMTPLLEHEKAKSILGSIVTFLLEELQIDYEPSASTTFKKATMQSGVEPDESYYISSRLAILGKDKIDLNTDPPPDLAIEIDITSRTELANYEALGVSELWRLKKGEILQINVLQLGKYIQSDISPIFSQLPTLRERITQCLQESKTLGTSVALRNFKAKIREELARKNTDSYH